MKKIFLIAVLFTASAVVKAQTKNFIDQPYLETQATVDTLVTPDRIHVAIVLDEADSRNKKSTERLEADMIKVLKALQINIDKQLTVADFDSDYRKYFLGSNKVLKVKVYHLIVNNAFTLSKVFTGLEKEGISNVSVTKTEYSQKEALLLSLKGKAILQAASSAKSLIQPLGQKLGKALWISDQTPYNVNAGYIQTLSGQPGANSEIQLIGNAKITNINFQDLKFSTTVSVKFAIQ
jgi:uncharacterized protein YggE